MSYSYKDSVPFYIESKNKTKNKTDIMEQSSVRCVTFRCALHITI